VALMVALPLLFAPFRALIGFRSDTHRSALGWRRVPYIWMGTMLQFGGWRSCPSRCWCCPATRSGPAWLGRPAGAGLAFLLVGAGCRPRRPPAWRWPPTWRPNPVRPARRRADVRDAAAGHGRQRAGLRRAAADFSQTRLIQVIQGAAVLTMVLNVVALWKQEPATRPPHRTRASRRRPSRRCWRAFIAQPTARRFLLDRGPGHRRLQHAGHPAGALRRRDPG
jgi:BCD family chlorophyll transporter-like MFS transporter